MGCRFILAVVGLGLLAACATETGGAAPGRVLVVDTRGQPVRGARLVPEPEDEADSTGSHALAQQQPRPMLSDAQGLISVHLDDLLWDGDRCYHFRVQRRGYQDTTSVVAKDLAPSILRVVLEPGVNGSE
jgi:hypothetical protein